MDSDPAIVPQPALVSVNKWDLNPRIASAMEGQARGSGITVAGRIRYDRAVTEAQICKLAVVEYQKNGCAEDVREVWEAVQARLRE